MDSTVRTQVVARLPVQMLDRARERSARTGESVSDVVRRAVIGLISEGPHGPAGRSAKAYTDRDDPGPCEGRLSVRIRPAVRDRFQADLTAAGISSSGFVRWAVDRWLAAPSIDPLRTTEDHRP